jgi:hypothetical protein
VARDVSRTTRVGVDTSSVCLHLLAMKTKTKTKSGVYPWIDLPKP